MNQQEVIERSVYERLRLKAVALGYTPDITTFANTPAGFELYRQAVATIAQTKGYAIEVFGSSSIDSKGLKKVPRIILEWGGFIDGDYNLSPATEYTETVDGFSASKHDTNTYTGILNILLAYNKVAEERVLHQIVMSSLTSRSYIPYYNQSGNFLVLQGASSNTSTPGDSIKEWVYSFEIPDIVFAVEDNLDSVKKLQDIEMDIQTYLGINLT